MKRQVPQSSSHRLWLADAAQVVALLAVLAPVVGVFIRGIGVVALAEDLSPSTILRSTSLRELTIVGGAWLAVFLAYLGASTFPAWVVLRQHRRVTDLADARRELLSIQEEQPTDHELEVLRNQLQAEEASAEERAHGKAVLGQQRKLARRVDRLLTDVQALERASDNLLKDRTIVFYALAGLVLTQAVFLPFTPWTVFVPGLLAGVLSILVIRHQSGQYRPLTPQRLWPLVPLAAATAMAMGVPGATYGEPARVETTGAVELSGVQAVLGRDDTFTYLWDCDSNEALALETREVVSMQFLPSVSSQESTLIDVWQNRSASPRPQLDCGIVMKESTR